MGDKQKQPERELQASWAKMEDLGVMCFFSVPIEGS